MSDVPEAVPLIKGHHFGHTIHLCKDGVWKYSDTNERIDRAPQRRCPKCQLFPTHQGFDPCLGEISGVKSACCGHGVKNGYIQWKEPDHE